MRILIALIVIILAFILGQYRFLSVVGINPNLILVGLLFFAVQKDGFRFFGTVLLGSAVLALIFAPNWLAQVFAVLLLAAVFYFLKGFLTGNRFLDFLTAIFLGTIIFYIAFNLFGISSSLVLIIGEILYNLMIGVLIWYAHYNYTARATGAHYQS